MSEPKAGNEGEERGAFEAWAASEWQNSNPPHAAWIGWQGRARLSRAPIEAVAVKPLEWRLSNIADSWTADHPYGEYSIVRDHRASVETTHGWFNRGRWIWVGSLEAAKAASQADYEQRIRSALVAHPLPQGGDTDELVERRLAAYRDTVDRVWQALGVATYDDTGGREISEIVADTKSRANAAEQRNAELTAERDEARKRIAALERELGK